MTIADIKKTAETKMAKSIEAFKGEIQKIRTGRAHPGILDQVQVDYYGSLLPISARFLSGKKMCRRGRLGSSSSSLLPVT